MSIKTTQNLLFWPNGIRHFYLLKVHNHKQDQIEPTFSTKKFEWHEQSPCKLSIKNVTHGAHSSYIKHERSDSAEL